MLEEVVKVMPMHLRKALILSCLGFSSWAYAAVQEAPKPQSSPYKIEVTVNKVLVPVVVRDKQGHSIGDLKEEDFHVFDNGKPHPLSAFMVEGRIGTEPRTATDSENNALSPTPRYRGDACSF